MNRLLFVNKFRISILILSFFIEGSAIGAAPKTVDQLLRNVNQKSIKQKKATLIKTNKVKEQQIRRTQPRNVMPTSSDFKVNTTGADGVR